ncbi:MAG TPA: hypothetical protein VK981_15715 [Ramlibacter sp.]|nr:hypothetical protein [Ramlibacter sp.]
MNRLSRKLVVAATLGLAAFATWAVTDFHVPTIEIAAAQTPQG